MTKYKYLGKEVDVSRFSNNDTAQLADGTWVPSAMLIASESLDLPKTDSLLETATRKRAQKSESN